jgi:hypothetical protein
MRSLLLGALALSACVACAASPTPPPPFVARAPARNATTAPLAASASSSAAACFAEPVRYGPRVAASAASTARETAARACTAGDDAERAACRFALAHEHFEARRFERAAPLLLAVAHDPQAADAPLAAQLALESLNVLGSEADPPRAACFAVMEEELAKLLSERCGARYPPEADRQCASLSRIALDLQRCSECHPPRELYARSAEAHLKLARDHCALGRGPQQVNEDLRCDELLLHAYQSFVAAQDPARAAVVRGLLLDPANGFQHTSAAKRVVVP